jgi:hypothetical protein
MALPPLASLEDLANEVDDPSAETSPRAQRLLARASTRVRSFTKRTFVDEDGALTALPDAVVEVVLAAAARAWHNPKGVVQDTTGPFTARWSERTAEGVYLTDEEKQMLGPHRAGGGLWTQSLEKCDPYLEQIRDDIHPTVPGGSDARRW